MDLRQYGQLAREVAIIGSGMHGRAAGAAYIVSKNSSPVYQASTKLLVNQSSTSNQVNLAYQDILMSQQLARTYANLLSDRPVVEETAGGSICRQISRRWRVCKKTFRSRPSVIRSSWKCGLRAKTQS